MPLTLEEKKSPKSRLLASSDQKVAKASFFEGKKNESMIIGFKLLWNDFLHIDTTFYMYSRFHVAQKC